MTGWRPDRGWPSLVRVGQRSEWAVTVVTTVLFAAVATGAVVAPRVLRVAEGDSLSVAVAQAPPAARRLSIQLVDEFSGGSADAPLADQRQRVAEINAQIDPFVLAQFGPPRLVADTNRYVIDAAAGVNPGLVAHLTFRVHPEIGSHSALVAGAAARPAPTSAAGSAPIEFELAVETAEQLGLSVGDVVGLVPDPDDLVTRQLGGGMPRALTAKLVGLRALDPPDDPYWFGDRRLHRASISDRGGGSELFAFAILSADELSASPLSTNGVTPFLVEQRFDLAERSIDLGESDALIEGFSAIESRFSRRPTLSLPGVRAGLGDVLIAERAQRNTARRTLLLAWVGALCVAFAAYAQLVMAMAVRRRGWIWVTRARGASRRQLVGAGIAETILLGGGALGAAELVGALSIGGVVAPLERLLLAAWLVGVVAIAGAIIMSETAPSTGQRKIGGDGARRGPRAGHIAVWIVAAAAVATFLRRGLSVADGGSDPLALFLPILVAWSVASLSRWVLPPLLRRVVAVRGIASTGSLLGVRRSLVQSRSGNGLVTLIVVAMTVAGLGLGIGRSIGAAATDASWTELGAPYRIDTRDADVLAAVRDLDGVSVSASGSSQINVDRAGSTYNVKLFSIDVAELAAMTAGTVAETGLPESLEEIDPQGRVPAVSTRRIGGIRVRVGDELAGVGTRSGITYVVEATRAELFGRANDRILVDRDLVGSAGDYVPGFDSLAIDAPPDLFAALDQIAVDHDATLERREVLAAQERDDPLSRAVRIGFLAAAGSVAALALFGLVAHVVATARERRRDVAILGLLGAGKREMVRALVSELVPRVVAGVALGTVSGLIVVGVFANRVDLSAFAAGTQVAIRPDLVGIGLIAVAFLAVAVIVVVMMLRGVVRARVARILRGDMDG